IDRLAVWNLRALASVGLSSAIVNLATNCSPGKSGRSFARNPRFQAVVTWSASRHPSLAWRCDDRCIVILHNQPPIPTLHNDEGPNASLNIVLRAVGRHKWA